MATPQSHKSAAPSHRERPSPRVAAVVVMCHLTNPASLAALLHSVVGQVEATLVVDNTPSDLAKGFPIPEDYRARVRHIPLGENAGVPAAQNVGIVEAIKDCYSHVLLLDDDSELPDRMVEKLLAAEASLIAQGELVAAVGPAFVNERTGEYCTAVRQTRFGVSTVTLDRNSHTPISSDHLIASGSLISIRTLQIVGHMVGDFFMDWFDIEWGLRAQQLGYKSFICPDVVMQHSIGNEELIFFGKRKNVHSDTRKYYILRNGVFLLKSSRMPRGWRVATAWQIAKSLIMFPILSRRPVHCLYLTMRAVMDGCCGRLGKLTSG